MYFKEFFLQDDVRHDANVLITEVNLDELDKSNVKLLLKPFYDDVEIVRETYNEDDELIGSQTIDCFKLDCYYDNEHDRIEISRKSNLDMFIFTVCKLLSIGRITLYNYNVEDVERRENVSTISENHVRSIILTLEEFKLLDGFCGLIDISGLSVVYFKGLHMSIKSLKESECDDFRRSDKRKEYFLRGEKLYKLD